MTSLVSSGLMSDAEVRTFQARLVPGEPAGDADRLARLLVAGGKLTDYQATTLLEGKDNPLLIDRYIILDTLDSGGMGVVFKALHRSMERIVALKLLPAAMVDSPDKVRRFRRRAGGGGAVAPEHRRGP